MPLYKTLPTSVPQFSSTATNFTDRPLSRHRQVLNVLAVILAAFLAVATVFVAPARAQSTVARIAGADRVDTAVAAAQAAFSSAAHVVLTTSDDYPDALAAAAYAADNAAPILLTDPGSLSPAVAGELRRLGTETVTILGGSEAVSTNVESAVSAIVGTVERISADTRYGTAQQLATEVGPDAGGRVALALGQGSDSAPGWADALSAGSLATLPDAIPTLLTTADELPPATADALRAMQPSEVLIVGGPAAISDRVLEAVATLGPATTRLAGANRYQTSVAVTAYALQGGVPRDDLVFVSGENFPDALGAAAFAADEDAPMLLVPSARLADSVDAFVRDDHDTFDDGLLIGGEAAVGAFVEGEISAALRGETRPVPPPPAPEPEPVAIDPYDGYTFRFDLAIWDRLAQCESGGNWSINTGNGYYGGIQFSLSSWRAVGGSGYPHHASRFEQIYRGEKLQALQGWGAWPACSRKIGLR